MLGIRESVQVIDEQLQSPLDLASTIRVPGDAPMAVLYPGAIGKALHDSPVEVQRFVQISPHQIVVAEAEQRFLPPVGLGKVSLHFFGGLLELRVVVQLAIALSDCKHRLSGSLERCAAQGVQRLNRSVVLG